MNQTKRKSHKGYIFWIVILLLGLLFVGLAYDSDQRLVTNEVTVTSATLPQGLEGLRVVELSDLHGKVFGENNSRLVQRVQDCAPDLIVLPGDFIETSDEIEKVLTLVRQLTPIAPVYYVTGNHEWATGVAEELMAALTENGVRCLRNEFEVIWHNDAPLLLVGMEDPNSYADLEKPDSVVQRAQAAYPGLWTLVIAHRDYWVRDYYSLPVDLILCGHAHGGVVRIPGIGGLVSEDRTLFPEYDAGLYNGERFQMFVSVGLGQTPYFPRILNNPEVACITLHAAG